MPQVERLTIQPAPLANDEAASRWANVLRLLFPEGLPRLSPDVNRSEQPRSSEGSVALLPSSTTKGQIQ
jgi:hypothetical protein